MSNYHWLTGEEMVPPFEREGSNPNLTTPPPPPPGSVIESNHQPINWSTRQKCQKLDNSELESIIREATQVLNERKNARTQKLIEKVCVALNELKEMGNVEFNINCDYDPYSHDILDEVDHFDASLFEIRGK